jgi:hypothetical protein
LIREAIAHAKRKRNDEYEKNFQLGEEFKDNDQLIDENQFINVIFVN